MKKKLSQKQSKIFILGGVISLLLALATTFWVIKPADLSRESLLTKDYQALQDSVLLTELKIRQETKAKIRNLHKDRLSLFQKRVETLRENIVEAGSGTRDEGELNGFLQKLTTIVAWVAGLLILTVLVLYVFVKRKKKQTLPPKRSASTVKEDPDGKIRFEFAPKEETESAAIPTPIAVKSSEKNKTVAKTKNPEDLASQMKELEAFFSQKNANDYSNQFGHTAEFEALYPKVSPDAPKLSEELTEIYPSSLKRIEKEDKEKSDILKLARRGYTSSDIARRLRISQDQVELFLRMHRDKN